MVYDFFSIKWVAPAIVIFMAVLTAGCGNGGVQSQAPETSAAGSVALGPISGGEVRVNRLNGTRIGNGTTLLFDPARDTVNVGDRTLLQDKSIRKVGEFKIENLDRSGLSDDDLVIVMVTGGQDIDPNDDGFITAQEGQNGPVLKGEIYAVVKLSDLIAGNVVINVFTTMAYSGVQESIDREEIKTRLDRFARYIFKDPAAAPAGGDVNADGVVDMVDLYNYDTADYKFSGSASSRSDDLHLRGQHLIDALLPDKKFDNHTFIEELFQGAGAGNIESIMAGDRGFGDSDKDGLPNIFEDPLTNDTDGDGLYDGDPLETDMDDDGISDEDELQYGLNPWIADAAGDIDCDGISNRDEIANGLNPTNCNDGATADTDSDGQCNRDEIEVGSNPINSAPQPDFKTVLLTIDQDAGDSVIINAHDPEGDGLRYVIAGLPSHGTADIDTSGKLTYTPEARYHGSDAITVEINDDANGGAKTTTVLVTIASANFAAPIVKAAAAPQAILSGDAATLTWDSNLADSCVIEPGIGMVDPAGSITVSPDTTTTYTITVSGPGGSATTSATVTVLNPPTVNLTALPELFWGDKIFYLTWDSTFAESCVIEPGIGMVDPAGSITVSPETTTTYTITATGPGGAATAKVTVTVIDPVSAVSISADPETIQIGESSVLTWSATDADFIIIDPNIGWFFSQPSGTMSVSPQETTTYTITAIGFDKTTTADVTVSVIDTLPSVTISADTDSIAAGESATLTWSSNNAESCVIEPGIGSVDINGSLTVTPTETTIYTITATGPEGTSTAAATVGVALPGPLKIYINDPADMALVDREAITVAGITSRKNTNVWVNGVAAVVNNMTFQADNIPLQPGANRITANASETGTEETGSDMVYVVRAYEYQPQPENSFGEPYEDLVPLDAAIAQYDPSRFSIITGIVQTVENLPINSVSVTIHDHPEYGTAATDSEGRFSIPVEGGQTLTIVYQKDGLISAQRKVYVPWNDTAVTEAICMIGEDPVATTVTFSGNPDTAMTHQGSTITDDSGSRSCTMVFSGDNKAYSVDEKGRVLEELTTITVRATEFTTPESMPAKLPPNSGYTYCAELCVDGIQRVRFEKPVVTWVNNFLGFDVGEKVPVGYYDRDKGVWVPSDNGVVVKLLDTDTDGIVDALDADGDNQPDDLDEDGSLRSEVKGLANALSYPPGSTFWRVALNHFTPLDFNFPRRFPEGAISPNPAGTASADQQKPEESVAPPDDSECFNSYIVNRERIFHEDIFIPGTDMTLHYASNRVSGYKTTLTVPASGAVVPDSLKRINVELKLAGRDFKKILDPLPNQNAEFIWDGLDQLGRPVKGSITAHVRVGFVYDNYYDSAGDFDQAFGQPGSSETEIRARQEEILWKQNDINIITAKGNIAEGWTLSAHHQLSLMDLSTLHKGDGAAIDNNAIIIDTIAGTGMWGNAGEGIPAAEAQFKVLNGLSVDASGNLYIADSQNWRIWKVDTDGIITTVAGGRYGYGGDGGPATQARLNWPTDVTSDSMGNLYISDAGNNRIRKVD
ncbi:MAG: cadherin-like domain-containing protein, partial [Proteobacteria bacterium]|nr:cadherin-like domain-containing protein [Pseudomonadota bacterium]